ncbi:MAG: VOC family protein [Beijerinckiaceae bacterium]
MTSAAILQSHQTPWHIRTVTLVVRNVELVSRFYQNIMGLEIIQNGDNAVSLGCDDEVLVRLVENKDAAPRAPRSPGLFHTAFLVPSRADLANWLRHALDKGAEIEGMSDHGVSEAIYLSDPEQNGIEIYCDRPSEKWNWIGNQLQMGNARFDVQGLLATAGATITAPFKLASGSRIGHIHLSVSDLTQAEAFFQQGWGMDRMASMRGANFFSNGGYHHHIAVNTWHAGGETVMRENTTGLALVEIKAVDAKHRATLEARWQGISAANAETDGLISAPWGLRFQLT